jgi:hypothetical protein
MLSTYANARDFTAAGTTDPAATNKAVAAATTALGVLVPGEVVSAATFISGALSMKTNLADGTSTWLHLDVARWLMLVLGVVAIPLLFRIGSGGWWENGIRGFALVVLTVVSFAGWLALQPLSIYQGWFTLDSGELAAIGFTGGIVIGAVAGLLGWSQAAKQPSDGT